MKHTEWNRPSSSGECEIYSQMYTCDNPKAIVQIAHGMSERSERYKDFMLFLAGNGYVVCANDHLGHGRSRNGEMSFFANKPGGFDYVIEDMHTLYQEVGSAYPDIPMILLGQSMGSILSALFADRYDYLSHLILMGTPAYNKAIPVIEAYLRHCVKKQGYIYESKLLNRVIWGKEPNSRAEQIKHHGWLTSDTDIVEAFLDDELCGAAFSDSANLEMMSGLRKWGAGNWGANIPDIPIMFMAGTEDRVEGYGKGTQYYYKLLENTHTHLTRKLIEGNRHEVLNERNKMDTYQYILKWIEKEENYEISRN